MPVRSASKFPLICRAWTVAVSAESITTLIPTAASCAWMNCASRSTSVVFAVSRCTVGFGKPDAATSFLASSGSYGVHGTFVASYQAVFAGGIGVQLGLHEPAEDDPVQRRAVDRLLERLPQLGARGERRAHVRVGRVAGAVPVADVDDDARASRAGATGSRAGSRSAARPAAPSSETASSSLDVARLRAPPPRRPRRASA